MKYQYKGWIIKRGKYGWFAIPPKEDANKERFGYSPNMGAREQVEEWVDAKTTQ